MKTIHTYINTVEAGVAQSLLESANIDSVLADEHSCTLGYGSVIGGVRLQVPDEQVDAAKRILAGKDGVTPLPDDFIPPGVVISPNESTKPPSESRGGGVFSAFLEGGIWSLLAFGALTLITFALGGTVRIAGGWLLLVALFGLGGIIGIVVRAIYGIGKKDASRH